MGCTNYCPSLVRKSDKLHLREVLLNGFQNNPLSSDIRDDSDFSDGDMPLHAQKLQLSDINEISTWNGSVMERKSGPTKKDLPDVLELLRKFILPNDHAS